MRIKAGRFAKRGKSAARKMYEKVETQVMAVEGRRSVRAKARAVTRAGMKAAQAGLLVGALTALEVVLHDLSKRHKLA